MTWEFLPLEFWFSLYAVCRAALILMVGYIQKRMHMSMKKGILLRKNNIHTHTYIEGCFIFLLKDYMLSWFPQFQAHILLAQKLLKPSPCGEFSLIKLHSQMLYPILKCCLILPCIIDAYFGLIFHSFFLQLMCFSRNAEQSSKNGYIY